MYLPRYRSHLRSICPALIRKMERHVLGAAIRTFADRLKVDPTKLPCLAQWKRDFTMETILIELRR